MLTKKALRMMLRNTLTRFRNRFTQRLRPLPQVEDKIYSLFTTHYSFLLLFTKKAIRLSDSFLQLFPAASYVIFILILFDTKHLFPVSLLYQPVPEFPFHLLAYLNFLIFFVHCLMQYL